MRRIEIDRHFLTQWRQNEFESGGGRHTSSVRLHFFGSKSTISRFGERFRDGQYRLVSFLLAVLVYRVVQKSSHYTTK